MIRALLLVALTLHGTLLFAAPDADTSAPAEIPLALVISKPAVNLHPDFVRQFQTYYNRDTWMDIGSENIMPTPALNSIILRLQTRHPELNKIDPQILVEFLLRSDLSLRLAKNGYIDAAKRELEYTVGAEGELGSSISRVVPKLEDSRAIFGDTVETALQNSIDSYTFLRTAEKERLHAQLNLVTDLLSQKKDLMRLGRSQRSSLINGSKFPTVMIAIVGLEVMGIILGGHGLIDAGTWSNLFFYSSAGVEIANLFYFIKKTKKLLAPWAQSNIAPALSACRTILANLSGRMTPSGKPQ